MCGSHDGDQLTIPLGGARACVATIASLFVGLSFTISCLATYSLSLLGIGVVPKRSEEILLPSDFTCVGWIE